MERIYFKERTVLQSGTQDAEPVWNVTRRERKKKIAVVGISRGAGATFTAMSLAFLLSKNVENQQSHDRGADEERLREKGGSEQSTSAGSGAFSEKLRWPEYSGSRALTKMVRERTFLTGYGGGREERRSVPAGSGAGDGAGRGGRPGCPAAGAAYVELRQPAAGEAGGFFAAGLDLRFRGNRFTDFFQIYMQGEPLPPRVNLHKGINWVVWRTPADPHADASAGESSAGAGLAGFPLEQLAGQWIVADSPPLESLQQYDLVIGVINPLPAYVFAGAETYEYLRDAHSSGLPLLWVVNCDNAEVNHSELKRFLRLPAHRSLPLLDPALFYRAQYACRLPAELLAAGGSPVKYSGAGSISSPENAGRLTQEVPQKTPQETPQRYDLAFAALKELEKEVRSRLEE